MFRKVKPALYLPCGGTTALREGAAGGKPNLITIQSPLPSKIREIRIADGERQF